MLAAKKHKALAFGSLAAVSALLVSGMAGGAKLPSRDREKPSVPTNVRVVDAASSSVSVAWDPSTDNVGVAGYYVFKDGARSTVTTTWYSVDRLQCGESLVLSIVAFDAALNKSKAASAVVSTQPCGDVRAPSAPSGFRQDATTQDSVILAWDPSADDVGVVAYGVYLTGMPASTTPEPAVTVSGLSCGSTHEVGVDAVDAAGNRSQRSTAWVRTLACSDEQAPSAPSSVSVTAKTESSVSLAWSPSSDDVGVARYGVSVDGVESATVGQTAATVAALGCGKSYRLGVAAYDSAGNRSPEATVNASTTSCPTQSDTTAPTQPSNLRVTSSTSTGISLGWSASSDNVGVAGYSAYVNGAMAQTTAQTSVALGSLSCGTAYTLDVEAVDAAGNRSTRASLVASTAACADTQPPSAPSTVAVSSRTATSIALSWSSATDNVGVVAYGLYRGGTLVATSTTTSGIVTDLTCGTSYTLAVDAVDAAGNRSPKTSVGTSTTSCADTSPPSAPSNLVVSNVSQTGLTLAWSPSADNVAVAGYDAYRGTTKVGSTSSSTYAFTGLACGGAYTLGVVAFDAAGNRSSQTTTNASTSACSSGTEWAFCANEGQRCAFSGTKEVRYGADTSWTAPRTFTDGVDCTNQVFGDPLVGVQKRCEFRDATTSQPPPSPPPSSSFPSSFYSGPAGSGNILPPRQGVLVGTAQSGSYSDVEQQLASLESSIGRKLDIEHRFMQGTCSLDSGLVNAIVSRGHIPMISWLPSTRNGGAILRGDADSCIRSFGQEVAAQPHKILLRPYWEFNGNWYEHSKDLDGSLLTADEHKAMWRRTVDRLRDGGAFPKASVVWCPGEGHYGNGDSFDEQAAYPGDTYVDWVCADGYNGNSSSAWCGAMGNPHTGWCSFREIFHDMLYSGGNLEMDFRGKKPLLIGETGSKEGSAGQKGDWFRKARDDIKAHMPGVLGFVYFDVAYTDGDWRIRTSESSLEGFRDLARDSYFNTR